MNYDSEQNWILCLGGSKSKLSLINSIHNKGFKCCLVDINQNCEMKNYSDLFLNVSIFNYKEILELLSTNNLIDKIILIIGYTSLEKGQFSAYMISKKLKLPFCSKKVLEFAWNKYLFKKFCKKNNFLTPEYIEKANYSTISKFLQKKSKIICKPKNGVGSINVNILKSPKDLQKFQDFHNYIFEEFLGNNLFSIDGLVINQKLIFQFVSKKHTRPNSFLTSGFSTIQDRKIHQTLENIGKKLFKKMHLNNSFFSLDVLLYNDVYYLIDFGILLDAEIDHLLFFLNIDIFSLLLDSLFNNSKFVFTQKDNWVISFLYPKKSGIITSLPIISQNNDKMIIKLNPKLGDTCNMPNGISDSVGYVIAKNSKWDKIREISDKLEQKITIK